MTNPIVKVVNKNREGALVRTLDGSFQDRIPWSEFDRNFVYTGQDHMFEMVLDEETSKKVDDTQARLEWVTDRLPQILIILNKTTLDLDSMATLGSIVQEYTEKFNKNIFDLKKDVDIIKRYLSGVFAS